MTVPVPDQLEYISDADGVTKDFPYPKRFLQKDEVVVALRNADGVDIPQILNTHYTIAGSSWANGGTISFITAPQAPNKVVRYRMTQAKQTVDLENNQRNDAPSVETQLDRLTMAIQDRGARSDAAWFGLLAEIIARKAGDAALNGRVDQEIIDRKNGDNALASLIGQSLIGSDHFFETQLALSFATVSPLFKMVGLGGYSVAGDAPLHMMVRVASEPSHPGKRRSLDRFMPDGSISLSNGGWWELANSNVTVEMFGAKADGVSDDAPAFRACRDYMVAMGGGVIDAPMELYTFKSVEMATYYQLRTSAPPIVSVIPVFIMLPARISIKGGGKNHTKFKMENVGSVNFGIFPRDYSDGVISDFELEGFGSNVGNFHGIFFGPEVNYNGVSDNVTLRNLFIHDVSSYGIGQNMQVDRVRIENVDVQDTGADGIDWKVHGPYIQNPVPISRGVFMENISVRRFGQRAGAGTPSGIGIRGAANLNNITIYEIPDDMPGIDFVPGIAVADRGEFRQASAMSTLSNWYCEGANPKGTAIAVRSWSSFAVNIGQGTAKWAEVTAIPGSVTPYAFDDGSHFHDIVCIPAHGQFGFRTTDDGTSFANCRVMADKVYFDGKRNNLTAGQTVFGLGHVGGASTSNSAARYVVKNGVTLTETTDYTWGANSVTLTTPVLATDAIMVVFAPFRSVRIEALYCSVKVRIDRWSPYWTAGNQAQVDTANVEIMWDGHPGITRIASGSIAGIAASSGVLGGNQSLRLAGAGTGLVEIDRPRAVNMPTSSAGLTSGQLWNDGGIVKVVS
ncbi:hypothetical protein [Ochrobactrum sp. MC-1LL]|uniref:hypothetical protein n=1 Tax=Ochrobactrum sp. MC-1LL TaxID=2735351 RepID=UPI001438338C|nr:hypothetical protein [Ochrobactrum sp. MC-1LL]NKE77532.1 hypothetical protein [Ochrobactrum sp. MC-1LL]